MRSLKIDEKSHFLEAKPLMSQLPLLGEKEYD